MFEVFGFTVSFQDIVTLTTIVGSLLFTFYRITTAIANNNREVKDFKRQYDKDNTKMEATMENFQISINNRFLPLEAQSRAQESNYSALNASLISIQNQLSSQSNRLDTLITTMIERKDR